MAIKVSVIMPVYNAGENLRHCMDSLVNQTLGEIEIICVDDGSSDNSPQILQEYAQADSRVKVIRQENAGAGAARNTGMRHAAGEYLSILDCDDFFEPDMLEKSYQRAVETQADIVVFRCDMFDDRTGQFRSGDYTICRELLPEQEVFSARDVEKNIFRLFIGWSWDKLFRRQFVEENGMWFQEQRTTNDLLFVFNGLIRARRITVMDNVFAHYRQGEGTLSVTREKSWTCFYSALVALKKEMEQAGCYKRFEQDYKNYCVHFSLWNLDTLKEPTFSLLFHKLKEEWFREMGVLDLPKSYFYDKKEYVRLRNICRYSAEREKKAMAFEKDPQAGLLKKLIGSIRAYGWEHTANIILGKFPVIGRK